MKIFLDFDDVVFNTRAFLLSLEKVFLDFGVDKQLFQKAYEELRADAGGKSFCYRFDKHIDKIRQKKEIDKEQLLSLLEERLEDTTQFIFSDVDDFLTSLKKGGYAVSILSFGDKDFQGKKVGTSKIAELVDQVIITQESKEKTFETLGMKAVEAENIWFLDDRVHFLESVKKVFPTIKTVLVSRLEGRFTDVKNNFCDYQVKDLQEAKNLVLAITS